MLVLIDNTVALSALVKGGSGSACLDRMAHWVHCKLLHFSIHAYFEYIQSDSNWADSLSRHSQEWGQRNGFIMRCVPCFCRSWREPLSMVFT